MKKLRNILLFCGAMALATSCSQDFLEPEETNYITEEQKKAMLQDPKELANLVQATLNVNYNTLQGYWSSHDDWGLRAFQLATDMMGTDLAHTRGWFVFDYQLDNFNDNYRRTNSTWNIFYDIVSKANIALRDYFSEEDQRPEVLTLKAKFTGQRGIAFFHLTNFYQVTYVGNEDKLGIPLPLKPEDENLSRSTLKECYAQIIKDLTFTVDHVGYTDGNADIDKAVAAAYLAKVYASMEDWKNTEKYAKIAQGGGAIDAVLSYPPIWTYSNADVLWGFDVTPVTSGLWASFYSMMDPTLPFYAGKSGQTKHIYNHLYHQMGKKDIRRKLYVNTDDNKAIAEKLGFTAPKFKYMALKFIASDKANTDYVYLRVQDPLLLEIEAMIEQNKLQEAKAKLKTFTEARDADFKVADTQDELRAQVRLQRRLELWGEGTSWLDARRWKIESDRTKGAVYELNGKQVNEETNHAVPKKFNLNTIEMIHKLPQREVNNNKNLIQN